MASVGITERAAKEKGDQIQGRKVPVPWRAARRSAIGEIDGLVKIIYGEPHGEILGAHIIGPEATEMIAEMGLAISSELTRDEIENTIHAHPTLSEAVHEAAHASHGQAIHI